MVNKRKIIEFNRVCESCGGTGIYVGFAEHDGAGVICRTCKGTGCENVKIEYTPFRNRDTREGVIRVYANNPGIGIGTGKGKYRLKDFGGMLYEDWIKGKPFPKKSEMRKFTCPHWWYQGENEKFEDWCHKNGMEYCGNFSNCPKFSEKEKCWKRWDGE